MADARKATEEAIAKEAAAADAVREAEALRSGECLGIFHGDLMVSLLGFSGDFDGDFTDLNGDFTDFDGDLIGDSVV